MKIELIKTEGNWVQTSLGCYISVNTTLLDVITPLNNPHDTASLEVPSEGIMKLVIRDMGKSDGYLASLSLPIALLAPSSGVWLPLVTNPSRDMIFQLKDDVQVPRIMLAIHNECYDDELFHTKEEIQSDTLSEIVLASEIALSKDPENLFLATSKFNSTKEAPDPRKHQDAIDILSQELENHCKSLEQEKNANFALKKKIESLLELIKTNSDRAKVRETSLLDLINCKEEELSKALELNKTLKNAYMKLELENNSMALKIQRLEHSAQCYEETEKELKYYRDTLKNSESNLEKMVSSLIEQSKVSNSEILNTGTSFKIEEILENTKHLGTPEKNSSSLRLNLSKVYKTARIEKNNSIDIQEEKKDEIKDFLVKALEKIIQVETVVKTKDYLYKVNGIEFSLASTEDGIYVKNGMALNTIENFMKNRKKTHSEIFSSNSNLPEKPDEAEQKKLKSKHSPKKLVLKPISNILQKYNPILSKSSSKDPKTHKNPNN
jgi:hypothetical protein